MASPIPQGLPGPLLCANSQRLAHPGNSPTVAGRPPLTARPPHPALVLLPPPVLILGFIFCSLWRFDSWGSLLSPKPAPPRASSLLDCGRLPSICKPTNPEPGSRRLATPPQPGAHHDHSNQPVLNVPKLALPPPPLGHPGASPHGTIPPLVTQPRPSVQRPTQSGRLLAVLSCFDDPLVDTSFLLSPTPRPWAEAIPPGHPL